MGMFDRFRKGRAEVSSGAIEIATLEGHTGVRCVAFSPDGKVLASGSFDNIKLWELVRK